MLDFVQVVNREALESARPQIYFSWPVGWRYTADFIAWQETLQAGAVDVGFYVRRRWIRKVLKRTI